MGNIAVIIAIVFLFIIDIENTFQQIFYVYGCGLIFLLINIRASKKKKEYVDYSMKILYFFFGSTFVFGSLYTYVNFY